jgi:hypothetical protein
MRRSAPPRVIVLGAGPIPANFGSGASIASPRPSRMQGRRCSIGEARSRPAEVPRRCEVASIAATARSGLQEKFNSSAAAD